MQGKQSIGQCRRGTQQEEPEYGGKPALKHSVGQGSDQLPVEITGALCTATAMGNIEYSCIVVGGLQVIALQIRFQQLDLLADITATKAVEQHPQLKQKQQQSITCALQQYYYQDQGDHRQQYKSDQP